MSFPLKIITPLKVIFNEEVSEITLPTPTGEVTILTNHTPFLSQISEGEIIIRKQEGEEFLAVADGIIKVEKNNALILADYARHAKDIDEKLAQEAKERAQARLKEKLSQEDFAAVTADLRKAIADLKTTKKRRSVHL